MKNYWSIFLAFFLLVIQFAGQGSLPARAAPAEAGNPAPAYNAVPVVTLNVPGQAFIGSNVSFTVTFNNNDPDPGYGPIIDLIIPSSGADGDGDGLGTTTITASYLGSSFILGDTMRVIPFVTGTVTHPFFRDSTGANITVNGTPGDKLVVLRLPFGSFTQSQPPATVNLTVDMSSFANYNVPLTVQARGGYEFGYTPLDDWCCGDAAWPGAVTPAWTSGAVTPTLFTLTKAYSGPEGEAATGPNFRTYYPMQYTLIVQIAPGQSITGLRLNDLLPANLQYNDLISSSPGGASCTEPVDPPPPPESPGGSASCTWAAAVSGSASLTFDFYAPRTSGGSPILDPFTGNDVTSCNNASITAGTWIPTDPDDTGVDLSSPPYNPGGCEYTLTEKSIAIQKGVTVVGGGGVAPGRTLEYTLTFQISDFFAFNNLVVTDVISDGQHYDPSFPPTLQVDMNPLANNLPAAAIDAANFDVSCNYTGLPLPVPNADCKLDDPAANNGTSTLIFRVSAEIDTRLGGPSEQRMVGGCIDPVNGSPSPNCSSYNDGPTTATLVFRTVVQDQFTDDFPSGDPSVDQGDELNNDVSVTGDLLDTATFSHTGYSDEADGSASMVAIGTGSLSKTIYAVNSAAPSGSPVQLKPGDQVTYRIRYVMPTGDEENLRFNDFLPLPVFSVADPDDDGILIPPDPAWSFNPVISTGVGDVPGSGVVMLGPDDTFYAYFNAFGGVGPTVATDPPNNSLTITYNDFDGPNEQQYIADFLFTVTVNNDPFADRLYLTNLANAYEGSTNAGEVSADSIVQILLTEPLLVTSKGVVATNNPNAVFTQVPAYPAAASFAPSPGGSPAWTGTISSADLGVTPLDSDVTNVDARDLVTFAIVIENQGSSGRGAFDITLQDTLPAGFQIPTTPAGLNLQLWYGDHTAGPGYTLPNGNPAVAADLFGTGIRIVDPGPAVGACQAYTLLPGRNVIIITYDLQVAETVAPGAIVNTHTVTHYAGTEGGPTHVPTPSPLTDTATTTVVASVAKTLFDTEIINANNTATQAVIGELATYRMVVTVPEGVMPSAQLVDTLDSGLAFVDLTSVSVSNPDTDGPAPGDDGLYSTVMTFDALGVCTNCVAGTGGGNNPLIQNNGGRLIFNFGDLTNTNRNNNVSETITIVYRAVALNVIGSQAGSFLNNSAALSWTGGSLPAVSAPNLTVIEPGITTAKSVLPVTGQAGDLFTYTVTLTNPNGSTDTDAWEVSWSDSVPAKMNYVALSLAVDGGQPCTAGAPTSLSDAGPLTATWTTFPKNTTCTLRFQVRADVSVNPGEVITNTAETRWTSYPGVLPGARSSYNPASVERTGADGLPGPGVLNDYRSSGSALITIYDTIPQKYLMRTSESFTGGTRLTIGEIVRYRLVVFIPKSTSLNFQVQDVLPAGMLYLDDGTARMAFVSDGGVTSAAYGIIPALVGCNILGGTADDTTPPPPLPCLLADNNVGSSDSFILDEDNYTSGGRVYFKLGTLANNDSDVNSEYVIIEFNALVDNFPGPGINFAGKTLDNFFQVFINGTQNNGNSNTLTVNVVEPLLNLTKTPAIPPSRDAGDTVTYTLTLSAANGVDRATAFELNMSDTLDANLNPLSAVITGTTQGPTCVGEGSGTTPFTDAISLVGQVVTLTASCLDPGQEIVATVTATVKPATFVPSTIPNSATATWSSLPGTGTAGNPTGSNTPGGSGATNGERNGTGPNPPNSYSVTASGPVLLSSPTLDKRDPLPLQYTIGQTVTYDIWVTLPEGVTRSLLATDSIPSGTKSGGRPYGMRYVSHVVLMNDPSLPAPFSGPTDVTSPSFSCAGSCVTGDDITLTFGDVTTLDDNLTNNNTFIIRVVLMVENITGNQDLIPPNAEFPTMLQNGAGLTFTGGSASDTAAAITVIEPRITTTKSVVPAVNVKSGDTVTYTLTFTNTGHSPAYDVTADDTLAQGIAFNAVTSCSLFDGSTTSPIAYATSVAGNVVSFNGLPAGSWDIPATTPNSYIRCVYTGIAQTTMYLNGNHTNTVDADWSSLDVVQPEERIYTDTTSYNFDGTQDTTTATFTTALPTLAKSDGGFTAGTIGDSIPYTITIGGTDAIGTLRTLTVTDTLPAGLIYDGGVAVSGLSTVPTVTVSSPNDGTAAVTVGFAFGDTYKSVANATITFAAHLADVPGNARTVAKTNSVTASYLNVSGGTVNLGPATDGFTIIEPVVTTTKSVLPAASVQAGDSITYTVRFRNTGDSPAYEVTAVDVLTQGVVFGSLLACQDQGGTPVPTTVTDLVTSLTFDGNPAGSWDIAIGNWIECQYTANAQNSLWMDGSHPNTVDADWTSQNGTTPSYPERVYDDSVSRPGVDGTQDTATASFTTDAPTLAKDDSGVTQVVIEDSIVFHLRVGGERGTYHTVRIADHLPAGLIYNNDASVVLNGSAYAITPTVSVPNDGTAIVDITWNFGDIYKDASDLVITYSAQVADVIGNEIGDVLINNATLDHDLTDGTPAPQLTDSESSTIAEPVITTSKGVAPVSGVKAGDVVTYTVRFTDTGTATAYDVTAVDTLAQGMAYTSLVYCRDQGGSDVPTVVTDLGATISLQGTLVVRWTIAPGNWIECQYTATAQPGIFLDGIHTNTVDADWTSQNGGRVYDDTVNRPGVDGTQDTAQASFNTDAAGISKSDGGVTQAVIGQTVHITLTISAPLGTLRSASVVDTLPAGLIYSAGSQSVSAGITPAVFSFSLPNNGTAPVTLTWDFGDAVVSASPVTIQYDAIVANVGSNVNGQNLINDVSLNYTDAAGTPRTRTSSDNFSIIEPVLSINKAVNDLFPGPGQLLTFTLTVSHDLLTTTADAFDVLIADDLPSELSLNLGSVNVVLGGGASGATNTSSGNRVEVTVAALPQTGTVSIQFQAIVSGTVTLGQTIDNTADLTWTSMPLGNPNERTGAGGPLNDYNDSSTITLTADRRLTKTLVGHSLGSTTLPEVTIGEILTYQAVINVPTGTTNAVTLTDTLDLGLAFVDCIVITPSSGVSTSLGGGFAGICQSPVVSAVGNPANPASDGRQVVFDFGNLINTSGAVGTVTIQYRVVVLDVIENQSGVGNLNNRAELNWNGGTLQTAEASVVSVVEPRLTLDKTADITVAAPGMTITFTLTVGHDPVNSATDAYDVLLTDVVPVGLTYVPGSLIYVSGIVPNSAIPPTPPPALDDTAAPILQVHYDVFPRAPIGTSVVQFQAVLGPVSPGENVTNLASAEWTTLPGIPPSPPPPPVLPVGQQSQYNATSFERRYDPTTPVDIYRVTASATVGVPSLPKTGFAPGRFTDLPLQAADQRYQALGDLWLEIPALGVKSPIIGVPINSNGWDLTWLWDQAGYLAGTAYPTHAGNSALTAHVYLSNGQPGPFIDLHKMYWGQLVIVHAGGQQYIYRVEEVRRTWPEDLSVLRHADLPTLTLITCQGYDQAEEDYRYRIAVRAVLMEVIPESDPFGEIPGSD